MNIERKYDRYKQLREIQVESGMSIPTIWRDYRRKHHLSGIHFSEYYLFRLYDVDFPKEYTEGFLGYINRHKYLDLLNPRRYAFLARNKFFAHLLLESMDIPTSELLFLYQPGIGRSSVRVLTTPEQVQKYLLDRAIQAFVCKPTEGTGGDGVDIFIGVRLEKNKLTLQHVNGSTVPLDVYLSNIKEDSAYIFESLVIQSDYVNIINSTSVNTVRVTTLLNPSGEVEILTAFMRMGRQGRWFDNASTGGNVDAGIDITTGSLTHPIIFHGYRSTESVRHHPDSKISLDGYQLREWPKIIKSVQAFQERIPYLKAIGWDIALTDRGPIVLEINDRWDPTGQLFVRRGWNKQVGACYKRWRNEFDHV